MTAEAALLGLQVISCYPGESTFVERYLVNQGLVERLLDPTRIAHRVIAIAKNPDLEQRRKRAAKLLEGMEDPLRIIVKRVFK